MRRLPQQDLGPVVGLALFALIAVGCALYAVASGEAQGYAMPGALLLLAAGQFAAAVIWWSRLTRIEAAIDDEASARIGIADAVDAVNGRVDAIEARPAYPPPGLMEGIAAEVRALATHVKSMAQRPEPEAAPAVQQAAAESQPQSQPASKERLDLLLEPVIELSTGATLHYRAQLNLTDNQGNTVLHGDLMLKADAGGMRAALDAHALKQVAPVLRRLRVRNPGLRIFVPLGAATLASHAAIARLTETLRREADITSGIVFEMTQDTLSKLDATGVGNLAELGRLGTTMALSNVFVSGLDLAALRQLGVRFLSISASAFDAGFGMSSAWRDFAQYARAMQFQITASDVTSAVQASAAAQIARLGHGVFFAPPRKVKTDAGVAQAPRQSQAA